MLAPSPLMCPGHNFSKDSSAIISYSNLSGKMIFENLWHENSGAIATDAPGSPLKKSAAQVRHVTHMNMS